MLERQLALFHPRGRLVDQSNPFGKDIANAGLFRALARHAGLRHLHVLHQEGVEMQGWQRDFWADHEPAEPCRLSAAVFPQAAAAVQTGALLRGQPYLSELAWWRRGHARDHDLSLIGLIHTLAPPAVRQDIGAAALAPVQPWDALVCTSPAVQDHASAMFDRFEAYAAERFGATRRIRPQLPLIPLGVDPAQFAADAAVIAQAKDLRQRMGAADDDVVLLWVGRLSFFEKAFPQPMLQAAQRAAEQTDQRVHVLMVGWFPDGDRHRLAYREAARLLAPDVTLSFADGNSPTTVQAAWAAGDVFLSLVDNIQETFGLTPLEAMAAGLPIVASDWDGYRYTIRDGTDGFLIPSLIGRADSIGLELSQRQALGMQTYQNYVGAVAQATAVDVAAAARALVTLINDPARRRAMGRSGRQRVEAMFSWPVVAAQYGALLDDLSRCRQDAGQSSVIVANPLAGDPFAAFAHFASTGFQDGLELCSCTAPGQLVPAARQLLQVGLCRLYPHHRLAPEAMDALLVQLEERLPCTVADLLTTVPELERDRARLTLVWLVKYGLLGWDGPRPEG